MPYSKDGAQYYLDEKDKRYITDKIHYYSRKLDGKENKSREWFKISKFWFEKSRKSSIKWRKISQIIARRCYALYLRSSKDKKIKKFSDFF